MHVPSVDPGLAAILSQAAGNDQTAAPGTTLAVDPTGPAGNA